MTMSMLSFNVKTGECICLSAGHPFPLIINNSNKLKALKVKSSRRLGFSEKTVFNTTRTFLNIGEKILIYTDGLVENEGPDGKLLNMRRLAGKIEPLASAKEAIDSILSEANNIWQGFPPEDDTTLVMLKFLGENSTNQNAA